MARVCLRGARCRALAADPSLAAFVGVVRADLRRR
jgi:hypothetical protein